MGLVEFLLLFSSGLDMGLILGFLGRVKFLSFFRHESLMAGV